MRHRKLVLLLAALSVALAVLLVLVFYEQRQQRFVLLLEQLEDPEKLVQQIEGEADLLRQFQQERAEATTSVLERLLIENLIDLEKEKIKSLSALATIQLNRLAPEASNVRSLDPDVRALQAQIEARQKQLEAASGAEAETIRDEIHMLQHRLEVAEVRSESKTQVTAPKKNQLSSAQISLITERLKSIAKSSGEEKSLPRTDRLEHGTGMWAEITNLFQIFGRMSRMRHYSADISRQEGAIDAYKNRLLQQHDQLMKKLSAGAISAGQIVETQEHRESEQQIDVLRKLHANVTEQASVVSRWADNLHRDRVDIVFRLLARLVVLAIVVIAILLVAHLLGEVPERFVRDEKSRYYSRKIISFFTYFAVTLSVVFALVGQFVYIGPAIGLVGAGVAIALQDVIVSLIGWFFIIGRLGISVGDRVEIDGVKGDVIDIGVFRIAMLEVGNWVRSEQATGRVVFFPNSFVFRKHFFNYHIGTRYIWDEIQVTLTYESNWRKAREAFLKIAMETVAPDIEEAEKEMRVMARRFLLRVGKLTPIVYMQMADSGVLLILRYVVPVRARRTYFDDITEKILSYMESQPDLDLAYPTRRNLQEPVPHLESPKEAHRKRHTETADRSQRDVAPIQERTPTVVDAKE